MTAASRRRLNGTRGPSQSCVFNRHMCAVRAGLWPGHDCRPGRGGHRSIRRRNQGRECQRFERHERILAHPAGGRERRVPSDPAGRAIRAGDNGARLCRLSGSLGCAQPEPDCTSRRTAATARNRSRVEVSAVAPLVETSNAVGNVVTGRELVDLPLNGRNFTQLGLLQPGVAPMTRGLQIAGGSLRAGQAYAVNGQRPESNNYLLDGATECEPRGWRLRSADAGRRDPGVPDPHQHRARRIRRYGRSHDHRRHTLRLATRSMAACTSFCATTSWTRATSSPATWSR